MIEFFTRSIPRKILASLAAIYVATYLATALVVYSSVRDSIVDSNVSALDSLANLKYERLANAIGALATNVTAWSELEVMNDLVSADIDKRIVTTLEELKQLYRLPGDLYAFDADGKLIATTRTMPTTEAVMLPSEWRNRQSGLVFLDKHADPVGGAQIVALDIPVFGTFDRHYRIGTLVLSYPWSAIEKLLFGVDTETVLIETGTAPRILASDAAVTDDSMVIGRSSPKAGLLGHWQVETLQDSTVVTRSLRTVGEDLSALGLALAIPMLALGRWLANRLTAPVMDMTRVVREIADTDKLDTRVPVTSADELGTLARSFNRMTESLQQAAAERERFVRDLEALNQTLEVKVAVRTKELEAAIAAQQRLIGDISHEIKSPLARLGVALGLVRRGFGDFAPKQLDRMQREIDNISALASELLTLARLDGAAGSVEFAEVDLSALIQQIVADAIFESPARASDLKVTGANGPVLLQGNSDLLRRAIENVVRNALFYTTAGTPVEIILSRRERGLVVVEIHDNGPGVPEAALAHLFEPFYRVDEARARKTGGSGVGLAICQRVIGVHHGAVRARKNEPSGLVVEMELPGSR